MHSAEWSCLPETLGSDHHIIQLTVAHTHKPRKTGTAQITEWGSFRGALNVETSIHDVDDWVRKVLDIADLYTKRIQLNEDAPAVDMHLLHLWEARRSLLKRLKRQKLNKKLKKRMALLSEQVQEYAERLGRQNWSAFCHAQQGTLSTKKTWHILRALLDNSHTRTEQQQNICRLIHNYAR